MRLRLHWFRTYYRMNRAVGEWHMKRLEAARDAFRLTRRVHRHWRAMRQP